MEPFTAEEISLPSMLRKNWKALAVAIAVVFLGALLLRLRDPGGPLSNSMIWAIVFGAGGLISVGIGQAILIFKLIEEREIAERAEEQKHHVKESAEEQKTHVKQSVETAVEKIVENLNTAFSVVGDCRREYLLDVLPPRRKKKEGESSVIEKNPEHFRRLWSYFVDLLSKDCRKEETRNIKIRMCSIAETDLFHADGRLTEQFSTLLKTGRIELEDGNVSWFCGCRSPKSCQRTLEVQVIILDPNSSAAGVRAAAEGAKSTNQVLKDIERTIVECKNLATDIASAKLESEDVHISLELATVDHHPLTSFIHTPDWVQIEIIHWGRTFKSREEIAKGSYECLGGRVPALIFSDRSELHSFLQEQFDLQWNIAFSDEPDGLAWLGSRKIELCTESGVGPRAEPH